jgi:hypothetical protein
MKRRTFLERIGSILALLGLTETEWLTLGNRYYQALATPNPRKLALLVGINQYPNSPKLSGCLTDVELQKELLIHRFGFASSDILTLTNEEASRESIEAAFVDHLSQQAKADDVVIFHFSGYGSRVKLGNSPETVQNALVPVDKNAYQGIVVNYLLEETLLQLLRSLSTDRATAVLDTSYYPHNGSQPLGLKLRSLSELSAGKLTVEELEFLKNQQSQNSAINQAMLLTASSEPDQQAGEMLFAGFSAGLFTYALTQYLWEATPATKIQILLSQVSSSMYTMGSKNYPELLTQKKNPENTLITENFPLENKNAQGVITGFDEEAKTAKLWLGGLPSQVLPYYRAGSKLTLTNGKQLVLKSRSGLTAKAQIPNQDLQPSLLVGELLQETVRVLPRNITLAVALDTNLERIELVDATSAFAAVADFVNIASTEQVADYVFGKIQTSHTDYGIFSRGGELILNNTRDVGEAVKVAVQKLTPKCSTLLAAKLWRLTENQGSSRLPVKVSLELVNKITTRVVMQRQTMAYPSEPVTNNSNKSSVMPAAVIPTVPLGSRLQYRIENMSDFPIYFILIGLNNHRSAIAFYPWNISPEGQVSTTQSRLKEIVIPPGETLVLPQNNTSSGWMMPARALFCEHQLIFGTSSFSKTLSALGSAKYPTADQQPISSLNNALDVGKAVLQDLHKCSNVKSGTNGTSDDFYVLDVNKWASINFSFQVV